MLDALLRHSTSTVTDPTVESSPTGPKAQGEGACGPVGDAGTHRCGEIARRGHDGDEHFYCEWLPRDHDGPCEPFPTAIRMRDEWFKHAKTLIEAKHRHGYIGKHRR